ncbi:MAG TPA: hypothetical protein IAC12_03785 [Candidatus Aphodovivens avistercoris]|nr:hypothetical protein [Candidatus Aphodovivens avistercoris]
MLDYRKTGANGTVAEYEYAIEGNWSDAGHVLIDAKTGKAEMADRGGSIRHARYASKLISELEYRAASGSIPDSGTVMWY